MNWICVYKIDNLTLQNIFNIIIKFTGRQRWAGSSSGYFLFIVKSFKTYNKSIYFSK